ncbi:unnamed protein product, partial [Rotaria magnacalcarata]
IATPWINSLSTTPSHWSSTPAQMTQMIHGAYSPAYPSSPGNMSLSPYANVPSLLSSLSSPPQLPS